MIKAFVFDAYGTLYDTQSVAAAIASTFPRYGDYITQTWRIKQLEYSWLRTLMGTYADFRTVTREALAYTLGTIGISLDERRLNELTDAYNRLQPYPDTRAALEALHDYRLAILSNGSPQMLEALVGNSGLGPLLEAVISIDSKRVFKPHPRAYELVEERLGLAPTEVMFVSSNGFDVSGAKHFGFPVARIARLSKPALRSELEANAVIGPATMFKALRTQQEEHGAPADVVVSSLSELAAVAKSLDSAAK
jgi:2-haloacid dehalogenase